MTPKFGTREYLLDLLAYAGLARRVEFPGLGLQPTTVEVARRFADALLQRFDLLIGAENHAIAGRPVRQTRVAVEILRRYLQPLPIDTAAADADYVRGAYQLLLAGVGVSYDELRMARGGGADDVAAAREALADRLGLDRPERIDQLFLRLAEVTETQLEDLFGLAPTTGDPFAESPTQPAILKWRMDRLRTLWRGDPPRDVAGAHLPAVDPDLVGEEMVIDPARIDGPDFIDSEIVDHAARESAVALQRGRAQEVADLVAAVEAETADAIGAEPTVLAAYDRVISATFGEVALDTALLARTESAPDPHEETNAPLAGLDVAALRRLVRLRTLAASGVLTEHEWADVTGIIARFGKVARYPTWLAEEHEKGVFCGPDFFVLPDAPILPELPQWRATPEEREAWEDTLRTRVEQTQTTIHALQGAVDGCEEVALIQLRDALIAAVAKHLGGVEVTTLADQLTQRLQVDFRAGDARTTTRLDQAIEAVHGVFFVLRMGGTAETDLPGGDPIAGWRLRIPDELTESQFDAEWHWMGTHALRRAAEFVKDHPESYLLPSLRDREQDSLRKPTTAFWRLVDELRAQPRLSREQARLLANDGIGDAIPGYLANLRAELAGATGDAGLPQAVDDYVITEDRAFRELELKQFIKDRFDALDDVTSGDSVDPHRAPHWFQEIFYFVPMAIATQLHRSGEYLAALDWFQTVYAYQLPVPLRKIYHGLSLEHVFPDQPFVTRGLWLREELNPHHFARDRKHAYTRFTVSALAECLIDYADAEFTLATDESLPRARTLYLTAIELFELPEMPTDNPIIDALRARAELGLAKLRDGRNIAGMRRPPESRQGDTEEVPQIPVIGSGGQIVVARPVALHPTPYRFRTLIERAKELVAIAQQMEAAYLSALEKRDAEAYTLLRAEQDLQVSAATVALQNLRVSEANRGVGLAVLTRQRAELRRSTYQGWINAGLNEHEQSMIDNLEQAATWRQIAAGANASVQIAQAITTAATASATANPAAAVTGAIAVSGFAAAAAGANMAAIGAETDAQVAALHASQERREDEWMLQRNLAATDTAIAAQEIVRAEQHELIVEQERVISQAQAAHAKAAVDYLANKFTNAELYEWMSGILVRIYGYFLQQATSMAQLAQNQLAFERQEPPPAFIQTGYWQPPAEGAGTADGEAPDRRGLTGSARLLADIYRLDQHAFETNKRKLQLSQTFSLAALFPLEFQRFRETGVLAFSTPMELFDRGFPGHYLRLIKRVRTSVVALIPPVHGVRATLTASGLSRVTTGPDVFQTTEVRRSPELVSFTSPVAATGMFELENAGEMLFPFESMGVDTSWELSMPKAANPFDFRGIADVLLTIEYTALNSFDYRQQVIGRLDRRVRADRWLSVRDQFPDAWYDLHNPVEAGSEATVRWRMSRADFPPNVADLRIAHLVVYFSRADGLSAEIPVGELRLSTPGGDTVSGGPAMTIDGLVSTRRGNGASWLPLIGTPPIGTWELTLPPETAQHFAEERVTDILFVVSYAGETPAWPQ